MHNIVSQHYRTC